MQRGESKKNANIATLQLKIKLKPNQSELRGNKQKIFLLYIIKY